ncbi:MAG: hypothetical protein AAGG75_07010 [Bacteroidota bacterium]
MLKFLYTLFKLFLLLTLPFIFLIRGSVFLHTHYELAAWPAILGGMLATALLLVIYFSFLYGRIYGKLGESGSLKRRLIIALLVVGGYSLYGLLYLSNQNVKHDKISSTYTQLHPILRLSISTILYADRSLIITDAARQPEDYRKMGLPSKGRSLHYQQKNGYVHAIDVRTKGRSELRNRLLKLYFRLMGLNTLHHVGTDDHLHISLMSHDSPGAI